MKKLFSPTLQAVMLFALFLLSAQTAYAQEPKAKPSPATKATPATPALPFCDQIASSKKDELQRIATAEHQSIVRCYDCIVRSSRDRTCHTIVSHPVPTLKNKTIATAKPSKATDAQGTFGTKYRVEVLQYPCYAGGVILSALILEQGAEVHQAIRDQMANSVLTGKLTARM